MGTVPVVEALHFERRTPVCCPFMYQRVHVAILYMHMYRGFRD